MDPDLDDIRNMNFKSRAKRLRTLFSSIKPPMTLEECLDRLPPDRRHLVRLKAERLIQEEIDRANEGLVSEDE